MGLSTHGQMLCLLLVFTNVMWTLASRSALCVKPVTSADHKNCSSVDKYNCKECHPLQWYIANGSNLLNSNSVLFFLAGEHHLSPYNNLSISNVTDFLMEGEHDARSQRNEPVSQIICTNRTGGGVLFNNCTNVSLSDIAVFNCGTDTTYKPDNFTVHVAVSFRSSFNITLTRVSIRNSTGNGLHVDRVYGFVKIQESSFKYSRNISGLKYSANARFYYGTDSKNGSSLVIANSTFMHGNSNRRNRDKPDCSGLLILIYAPSITVNITNITAAYNTARNGGNVAFVITYFHENTSMISITNSSITHGSADKGAGLMCYVRLHYSDPSKCYRKRNDIVSISRVNFANNTARSGGAVYIHQQQPYHIDCTVQKITFTDCVFNHNKGDRGIAVAIIKFMIPDIQPHNAVQFDVTFRNCDFSHNSKKTEPKHNRGSVMMLLQAEKVTIINSNFTYNSQTGISLVNSHLCFIGDVLFKANKALHGGALNLCDSSLIYLRNNTHVKLIENYANYSGGAIFAEQRRLDVDPPCFYQPLLSKNVSVSEMRNQVSFEYINNTAGVSGHALYGGSVDYCYSIKTFPKLRMNHTLRLFNIIHNLSGQHGPKFLQVTSDPYNVVFCNESEIYYPKSIPPVFSGERFSMSLSAVGQMNGSTPAFFSITARNRTNVKLIWEKHELQKLCHTVHLTVYSSQGIVTLELRVQHVVGVTDSKYSRSMNVKVQIKECPWIFKPAQDLGCDCAPLLQQAKTATIECNITEQSFNRSKNHVWIGCHEGNGETIDTDCPCDTIVLTEYCSREFCSNRVEKLTLKNASLQCQPNREGLVCGRCMGNYSLTLGPSDCVSNDKCSIWKLPVFLLVFIIAGFLLVFFLALFNFTVSQGTVYGLLFYASIVHANQKSIFQDNTSTTNFFRVFIAWLNLDFGFKVCLYPGMDAYQKIWLEFLFVFYLLSLAVIIIFLSNKFIFFTRLVGRNVVNVLSTILVLSFMKVTRISIKAVRYITLSTSKLGSDLKHIEVWYYDGNVSYLEGKHIPLAAFSILLLIVVSLYVLSLLFIQCLQRRSNWLILRWVNKLRPFFDANTGPCRDHYRFWPGLLLFSLFALFSMQAPVRITPSMQLYIGLAACVFMFVLACISPHGVYKKWPLNVLEFSFFLNLGFLCALMPICKESCVPVSNASVGIALVTFVLILIFHGYQRISNTRRCQRLIRRRKTYRYLNINEKRIEDNEASYEEVNERTPFAIQRAPSIVPFRESLLSDD